METEACCNTRQPKTLTLPYLCYHFPGCKHVAGRLRRGSEASGEDSLQVSAQRRGRDRPRAWPHSFVLWLLQARDVSLDCAADQLSSRKYLGGH